MVQSHGITRLYGIDVDGPILGHGEVGEILFTDIVRTTVDAGRSRALQVSGATAPVAGVRAGAAARIAAL